MLPVNIFLALFALISLPIRTQTLLWAHNTTSCVASTVILSDDAAFVPTYGGHFLSLSRSNGQVLWRNVDVGGQNSPVLLFGTIYFPSESGVLYALNKDTGKAVWSSGGHIIYNNVRPAIAMVNNMYVVFVGGADKRT